MPTGQENPAQLGGVVVTIGVVVTVAIGVVVTVGEGVNVDVMRGVVVAVVGAGVQHVALLHAGP